MMRYVPFNELIELCSTKMLARFTLSFDRLTCQLINTKIQQNKISTKSRFIAKKSINPKSDS